MCVGINKGQMCRNIIYKKDRHEDRCMGKGTSVGQMVDQ